MPYRLLRPLLFSLPAETAHTVVAGAMDAALGSRPARDAARALFSVDDPALRVSRWGIEFPNPVGLAAGFDKSGAYFNALGALGFGFVEIGTVTALPQPGNPRPRLFRLPEDGALLNRLGFNNPGAEVVARRLARTPAEPVLGINLGKSKVTPLEEATADYLRSLELLEPYARYLVVNVSSPNTPGLRELQDKAHLTALLGALHAENPAGRPVLVKVAPDLTDAALGELLDVCLANGVAGLIATNTTIERPGVTTAEAGGLSGRPLAPRALQVVRFVAKESGLPVVGVGGITTRDDVSRMLDAGAALVQLYTGLIYHGPRLVRQAVQATRERT